MYKITAPEKFYKGVTSCIVFVNGTATAELDAFTNDWFISKGYDVVEINAPTTATIPKAGTTNEDPEAGEQGNEDPEKGE